MTTPQTTTLETSRKLKELGVPQETIFWWGEYKQENQFLGEKKICTNLHTADKVNYSRLCSAYLSDEIGQWLPLIKNVQYGRSTKGYLCKWVDDGLNMETLMTNWHDEIAEALAECLGKMLIWLIENGYVDVKSLSKEKI